MVPRSSALLRCTPQCIIQVDIEELVKRKVDSGAYRSASDVVRDALELLEKRDVRKLDALRQDIQHAVDQVERGEFTEYETDRLNELFEKVATEGKKRLNSTPKPG